MTPLRDIYSGYSGKTGRWTLLKFWEKKEAFSILEDAGWYSAKDASRNKYGLPNTLLINPRIKQVMAKDIEQEVARRAASYRDMKELRDREPGSDDD